MKILFWDSLITEAEMRLFQCVERKISGILKGVQEQESWTKMMEAVLDILIEFVRIAISMMSPSMMSLTVFAPIKPFSLRTSISKKW